MDAKNVNVRTFEAARQLVMLLSQHDNEGIIDFSDESEGFKCQSILNPDDSQNRTFRRDLFNVCCEIGNGWRADAWVCEYAKTEKMFVWYNEGKSYWEISFIDA